MRTLFAIPRSPAIHSGISVYWSVTCVHTKSNTSQREIAESRSQVVVTIKREEVCQNKRLSKRQERTREKGNPHRLKLGSSCAKRCTTSEKANTAQGRPSRPSRLGFRRPGVRA